MIYKNTGKFEMAQMGEIWGKTNLKELSRKAGHKILLESTSHLPPGFRWHSLLHHMIDVGACAESLLKNPVIIRRFEHIAGCRLTPALMARLIVLVMLHDLGKAQADFQDQIISGHNDGARGHMEPWLASLLRATSRGDDSYLESLAEALDLHSMQDWFCIKAVPGDENDDSPLESILAASTFHHGGRSSLDKVEMYDLRSLKRVSAFGVHPLDGLRSIMREIRNLYPDAWMDGEAIPVSGDLIHWVSGLLMISDWMGSGSEIERFPYWDGRGGANGRMRFARDRATALMADIGIPVARELGTPEPLSALVDKNGQPLTPTMTQEMMLEIPADQRLILIEAPTGDGKTEAAIIRYLFLLLSGKVDSLYFAVPTRSAGRELHERIETALSLVMPKLPGKVIAAMGGKPRDIYDDMTDIPWAAGDARRFMAAPIAVGTIDQAYLSVLMARHADMRAFLLSRSLLVIDEAHAADPYMTELTAALVDRHLRWGGHVLLMSATLGSAARCRISRRSGRATAVPIEDAIAEPYPLVRHGIDDLSTIPKKRLTASREKTVRLQLQDTGTALETVSKAVEMGARVLIIRSTVADAVATQVALEALGVPTLSVGGIPTLHHGQFAAEDRKKLDTALLAALGKRSPVRPRGSGIACITTQTGEQSLDLNADLIVTDPCPTDVFLQRLGRLHRHPGPRPQGFEQPICIILDPGDLEQYIIVNQHGGMMTRGTEEFGFPFVYKNLLSVNALLEWVREYGSVTVPRDNRRLVESGSHEEHLFEMAERMGGRWTSLAQNLYGRTAAERGQARRVILDVRRSFLTSPESFIAETAVSTRLGDSMVTVECDQIPAAFGGEISTLQIPIRQMIQAIGTGADFTSVRGILISEGSEQNAPLIQIGESRYSYGRYGLMPIRLS